MTDYAWRGTDGDWEVAGNWIPPIAGGPQGANTAVFDGAPATYPLPDTNCSTSEDMNFTFTGAYVGVIPSSADSFYGTLILNSAAASIRTTTPLEGGPGNCPALTLIAGTFTLHKGVDGPVVISVGATLNMTANIGLANQDGAFTNAGTIGIADTATIHFNQSVTNTGTINCNTSGAMDFNGLVGASLLGAGGTVILGAVSACTGPVNISNATWTVALGATWIVDFAGTLNLGTTDMTNLALYIQPTEGTIIIGGNVTGAGATLILGSVRASTAFIIDMTSATSITNTGARIDCNGTGRVTAAAITGQRLVIHRAVDSGGNPVRSWNGDGCTNVRFLGRRIIGDRLRAVA